MLDGDVDKCIRDLNESIQCCNKWQEICQGAQEKIKSRSTRPNWNLDKDKTIFAEIEAFIQRCKDLKEICEAQLQFARKSPTITMPHFGGTKGPEITDNLMELQTIFQKNLGKIRELDYDILDVKRTNWHDDFGQTFKDQIKNLEIMYHNVISFKNVATLGEAVEMLENFDHLAQRPMVKDHVQKKAAEQVYKIFMDEIKEVEETFEAGKSKRKPPMPFSHPEFGGQATWAQSLITRITKAKAEIDHLATFIPIGKAHKEALEKHEKLSSALERYIMTYCCDAWKDEMQKMDPKAKIEDLEPKIEERLQKTILMKHPSKDKSQGDSKEADKQKNPKAGLLESNFDTALIKILAEVPYWNKIANSGIVTVPHVVTKFALKREALRILRENVMVVVREYNNIIHLIRADEKPLFKQHLEELDSTIRHGITKLNWNSKITIFVVNSRIGCKEVSAVVKKFHKNKNKIDETMEKITTTILTNIGKTPYQLADFVREQEGVLAKKADEFKVLFDTI